MISQPANILVHDFQLMRVSVGIFVSLCLCGVAGRGVEIIVNGQRFFHYFAYTATASSDVVESDCSASLSDSGWFHDDPSPGSPPSKWYALPPSPPSHQIIPSPYAWRIPFLLPSLVLSLACHLLRMECHLFDLVSTVRGCYTAKLVSKAVAVESVTSHSLSTAPGILEGKRIPAQVFKNLPRASTDSRPDAVKYAGTQRSHAYTERRDGQLPSLSLTLSSSLSFFLLLCLQLSNGL